MATEMKEKIMKLMTDNPEEAEKLLDSVIKDAELKAEKKDDQMQQNRTNRVPLSQQRGVDKIPVFSGKGFMSFQKKLLSFAQDEPGCAVLLRLVAQKFKDQPIDDLKLGIMADEPSLVD